MDIYIKECDDIGYRLDVLSRNSKIQHGVKYL